MKVELRIISKLIRSMERESSGTLLDLRLYKTKMIKLHGRINIIMKANKMVLI